MDNINFKKVLDDGELFNQQANYEDNFEKINQFVVPKITNLETNKADKTYVNAQLAEKVQNFKLKNEVVNGDFSQGTTGFTIANSSASVNNKILSLTGIEASAGQPNWGRLAKSLNLTGKVFMYAKVRCVNGVPTTISLRTSTYSGEVSSVLRPVSNQWYELYGIIQDAPQMVILQSYIDNATLVGKTMEIDGNAGLFAINMSALNMDEFTTSEMLKIIKTMGYFTDRGMTQKEAFKISLSLMRENRNAIIALGGTIV